MRAWDWDRAGDKASEWEGKGMRVELFNKTTTYQNVCLCEL